MIDIVKILGYKSDSDDQTYFKETILINITSTAVCFFIAYSINNYVLEHKYGIYIMLIGGALQAVLLSLFVKKKISYLNTVNTGLFITIVCLFFDVYFTGGIFSPSLPWLMLIPILSFLLLEKSVYTRFWLFKSILLILIFGIFTLFDHPCPNRITKEELPVALFTSYIGLALMLFIITKVFDKKKNKIFQELEIKQKELLQSEKRFRTMFEKAPLGIGLTNSITGEITKLNPRYAEIVGRNSSEMDHLDWMSITHPDDVKEDLENMARMNSGEIKGYKMSKRYIKPDNSIVWVDVAITPIESEDKSNPFHLCMIEDITERKNAERILKTKEQTSLLLRHASQVPGVIYQFQHFPDGTFTFPFVSEGVTDLFEISAKEVMTDPYNLLNCVHKEDLEGLMSSMAQSIDTLTNWVYDCRVDLKTKGIRWFRGNSRPELLADGSVICHGYISDITNRKELEDFELARNKELLAQQNVLLDLSRLPSDLEFHQKIKTILSKTAKTVNCEMLSVWMFDENNLSTEYIYHLSRDEFLPGKSFPKSDFPIYFNEISKNLNIVVNNVLIESPAIEFLENFKEIGITSLLDVPLRKGKEIFGVISFEHIGIQRNWSSTEIAFARSISDFVTLAFESEELKKAKDELKINEERWKFAIEGSNDGMWDWNVETSEVYRSPRWSEMLGFGSNEITENLRSIEEWSQRIHPDDVEWVTEEMNKHFRLETPSYTTEHRVQCKDGNYKWILDRGKAIVRKSDGTPLRVVGTKTDITERKNAELELQQSKEKLQAIFTGSNDAILLLTEKGFFDCNPKALEMFNIGSKEELTSSHPSDISPEFQLDGRNSFEKANEMIQIAFEKGVNRFEWLHKQKNGEPFPAEVLLSAFNYGTERVLQATVQNITERKLAEYSLERSEERLRLVLAGTNDGWWDWDLIENKLFYSPRWWTMLGYEPNEFELTPDFYPSIVHPDDVDRVTKKFKDSIQGTTTSYEIECRLLNKNGIFTSVLSRGYILRDVHNKALRVSGSDMDLTERKRADEKLKQSEEKYRSLIENSPEIILITDKFENIQFSNFASHRYKPEQIINHSIYEFVHARHHETIKKAHSNVLNGAKYESYETEGTSIEGERNWFLTHVGPKYLDEKVVGLVLFIRNITDRKISEEKIKQSLYEKEVLLKEVHHRVKNNLQIISSILNLQSSTISDQQTLDLLKNSQDRIRSMSLIHELLYQTKDFSTINFSEYIRSISTNLFQSYNQNKKIDLKLDLDPLFLDLDLAIPCGLIINELITNSLKYAFTTEMNGEILISLKQKEEDVLLKIEDNGKGFPQHINFRDTESLGMQLVVSLTDQIDGEITLDNTKGTKYELHFKNTVKSINRMN